MTTVTENDLKKLETMIADLGNQITAQNQQINEKLNDMRVDIATLKEGQNSINRRIDDTLSSLNKRLDNLDFIARTIIASVAIALLAGFAKFLYPNLMG